jgi:cytochrome c553
MNVSSWPLAGILMALMTTAQAADPVTVYTKGGANPAAMACVTCHGAEGAEPNDRSLTGSVKALRRFVNVRFFDASLAKPG